MEKYLFLDIDGVIALPTENNHDDLILNETALTKLGELIEATNCSLVISSSRRQQTLEETKTFLTEKGFPHSERIVGQTCRGYQELVKGSSMRIMRGNEIRWWIDNYVHRENNEGAFVRKKLGEDYTYCIIDDKLDMLYEQAPYFIKINPKDGFTAFDAMWVAMILNGKAMAIQTLEFPTYNLKGRN